MCPIVVDIRIVVGGGDFLWRRMLEMFSRESALFERHLYSHVSLCGAVILDLVVLTTQEAVTLATVQCTTCVIVVS